MCPQRIAREARGSDADKRSDSKDKFDRRVSGKYRFDRVNFAVDGHAWVYVIAKVESASCIEFKHAPAARAAILRYLHTHNMCL